MSQTKTGTWTRAAIGFLVCLAVTVLSWFTAIIERQPLHSDSGVRTYGVWGFGLGAGVVLLIRRRWSWAAVFIFGTLAGVIAFITTVFMYLLIEGD
jgi:hypothetical protein